MVGAFTGLVIATLAAPVAAQPTPRASSFARLAVAGAAVATRATLDPRSDRCVDTPPRNRQPTAVIDVAAPLADWTVETVPRVTTLFVISAGGQPPSGSSSHCIQAGSSLALTPGRWAVWTMPDYDEAQSWQRARRREVTVVVRPVRSTGDLLATDVAPPAGLPPNARVAEEWFPNLAVHGIGRPFDPVARLPLRFALLARIPTTLWTYPGRDLQAGEARPVFPFTRTSDDPEPPALTPPRAGEPIVRLSGAYASYMTADGALWDLSTRAQEALRADPPAGGAVLLPAPREAWAPWEALRAGEWPDPLGAKVRSFVEQETRANECRRAASTRYDNATSGVIVTARQRAAASRRIERDRRACRLSQVAARREELRAELLATRQAEMVRLYDALRTSFGRRN